MEPRRQANGHFAVDAALQIQYRPAGNFDFGAHDRWVREGHCPVVSGSKAWCSLKAGHLGQHGSPFIRAGTTGESFTWWDR
jgi:hypothetical protein